MNTNEAGRNLISKFEGCRLKAYADSGGVWTIGYGHTSGVKQGDVISQEQADKFLAKDLKWFDEKVNKTIVEKIDYELNQWQFNALVSFCYNLGSINGELKKALINKNLFVAVKELLSYHNINKKFIDENGKKTKKKIYLKGLHRRRLMEAISFTGYVLNEVDKIRIRREYEQKDLKKFEDDLLNWYKTELEK